MIFQNRQQAGKQLVSKLEDYKNKNNVVVLGLPRGGVILSFEVAKALNLPMDLAVSRKISAPNNPEFAIGAIDESGYGIFDESTIASYGITQEYIKQQIAIQKQEANRRLKLYRSGTAALKLHGKTVILVDDGIATGSTMLAAIHSVKNKGTKQVIVAVPVTARDSLKKIQKQVDQVVYLSAPIFFNSVGSFYKEFSQTTDQEVINLILTNKRWIKDYLQPTPTSNLPRL